MDTINFSTNWNNKLACKVFTTIRLHNPLKYFPGKMYEARLNGTPCCHVKCIRLYTVTQEKLSDYICLLDTGYAREQTLKILSKMYPHITKEQKFDIIVLQKVIIPAAEQKELEFTAEQTN